MQRPILVLVIVLAALGALFFGVSSLLDKPTQPGEPAPHVEDPKATPSAPTKPAKLEPDAPKAAPASAAQRTTANDEASFRYDNALLGTIVDAAGRPVAGARVTLTSFGAQAIFFYNDPRPENTVESSTDSDEQGRFAFRSLEPRDRYRIAATHPEYARYEGFTVPIPAQGEVREAPIVLRAGGTLSGLVQDEAGKAVAGATVALDGMQFQVSPYEAPDRLTTTTNADGAYSLPHVSPGARMLTVKAQGYGTANVPGIEFDDEHADVKRDVVLKPAQSICGKVRGANGQGIAGAKVLAIGFNSAQQSARCEVLSNDQGEFCLDALLPGKYNVIAVLRGWRFRAVPMAADTKNIVIEGQKEADACGTVVDADTGAPITDFQVRLRVTFEENPVTQPVPESRVVVEKAADGAFCIPGVQATSDGAYLVEASAPGYAPGFSKPFSIETGRSIRGIEVRLGHGGALTGRVVDANGRPVAQARVETHDNEWTLDAFTAGLGGDYPTQATSASTRTDAAGRFTLKNLTPEVYQITVEAGGFCAYEQKGVQVTFGQANDVGDVRLTRGGSVRGKLVDGAGQGFPNGLVTLEALEGDRPRSYRARTGADGTFVLSNVVPGGYKLVGSNASQAVNPFDTALEKHSQERQITIADGDEQSGVEVTLNP